MQDILIFKTLYCKFLNVQGHMKAFLDREILCLHVTVELTTAKVRLNLMVNTKVCEILGIYNCIPCTTMCPPPPTILLPLLSHI